MICKKVYFFLERYKKEATLKSESSFDRFQFRYDTLLLVN